MKKQGFNGFTLIELLITILIMGMITAIGAVSYRDFNKKQTVTQAALNLVSNLRVAQSKAMAQEKPASGCNGTFEGYKIFFTSSTTYEMRVVCSGTETMVSSFTLPTGVTATYTRADFFFTAFPPGVFASGSVTVRNSLKTAKVVIEKSGNINSG